MMIPLLFMCAVYSLVFHRNLFRLTHLFCVWQNWGFISIIFTYLVIFNCTDYIASELCGDLWITKRKMGASFYGPFRVNIMEFGCAKWETPRNALFSVVDFGLKFLRNCSQYRPTFSTWLQLPGYLSSLSCHCIGLFVKITNLITWDMRPFICIQ